jgi:hypothetical protein
VIPRTKTIVTELGRQSATLFALLDAAREPTVRDRAHGSGQRYQSLYQGDPDLEDYGPFLVELGQGSAFLGELVQDGWGKSWGVYLSADLPFEELRRHLRRFLMVKLHDRRDAYFRFYDPRVLRVFLGQSTLAEAQAFVGPVQTYWVESEDALSLLRFTVGPSHVAIEACLTTE